MLRQDNPVVGRGLPPRALPIRYVLAWKVKHVRRRVKHVRFRVREFRRTHDGIGFALLTCVIAVGVGFLVAQYGA